MSPTLFRVTCVLPFLALSTLLLQARGPRRIALLIGINEYSKQSGLKPLDYAEADVKELAELLRKSGYVVTLLTGADATHDKCAEAIERIKQQKLNNTDLVLVGLAGHGKLIKVKEKDVSFFIPHDGVPKAGRIDSLISVDALVDDLQESGAGSRFLLIDACRDVEGRGVRGGNDVTFQVKRGTGVLFSCKEGEMAQEPNELKHGLFFYHVIKRLRECNAKLTWGKLVGDITEQVPAAMPKRLADLGAKQHPDDVTIGAAAVVIYEGTNNRPAGNEIDLGNKQKLILVPIKARGNSFLMGSSDEEVKAKIAYKDEAPQHEVEFTHDWDLGKFKVTVGQFKAFMADNPDFKTDAEKAGDKTTWRSAGFDQSDDHPVVYVSWNDAQAFCAWLSKKTGRKFRLPFEAEWEYSCRAGTTTRYSFGDDEKKLGDFAWFQENSGKSTQPVGMKKPNPWGLFDMHGNTWEWCEDGKREYKKEKVIDPEGPSAGADRVIRGGPWYGPARDCRSADRSANAPSDRFDGIGFRVLCSR